MSTRVCPVCSGPLIGRSDKKYCSDQCRTVANSKIKIENERLIIEINQALRKNRSILKKLCPAGETIVKKEVLDAMGYEVQYFSSLFLAPNKQVYYICYDYAFTPLCDNNIEKALIVPKPDYMKEWDPWRFVKK